MYEQVFGFTARPFAAAPYIQNYFPAESIHYALSQSRLCIERANGPVVITGPSGTGKSLLLAMLAEQYAMDYAIANIVCSNLVERKSLLQHILFELNLPYREMSEGELRLSLIDYLKNEPADRVKKLGVLMLVDEAHTLSAELLDELRGITNFVRAGRPAISLVMAGSPSLEGNLIETKSESFNQRIAARCFLSNLGKKETMEYVLTQVERAGGNPETLFTAEALGTIFEVSDGCPRLINQVCDYSLVLAASQNLSRVNNVIVSDAWNDVQSIPASGPVIQTSSATSTTVGDAVSDDVSIGTGDLVLEFGSLDDELEPATTNVVVESVSSESVSSELADESFEYRLQDEDDSRETREGIAEQLSEFVPSLEISPQQSIVQYETKTEVQADAAETVDPAPDFADPFAESFEVEESVDPSFVPFVSAQNINSLMVTPEQLALLELPIQQDGTIDDAGYESPAVSTEPSLGIVRDEDSNMDDDLVLSQEGLASLDQMQEDIRRLQQELQFSQQDFRSEAVHPDFAIVAGELSVEEALAQTQVADDSTEEIPPQYTQSPVVFETDTATETALQDNVNQEMVDRNMVTPEMNLSDVSDGSEDDDRDIMIISQPEKFHSKHPVESECDSLPEARISTGQARRVEYNELFRQLRSAN